MKPSFYDASARQDSGGPSPVLGRRGIWNTGPRSRDIIEVEEHIAGLSNSRRRVCGWLGANCTAPDRLLVSVAICLGALLHRESTQR